MTNIPSSKPIHTSRHSAFFSSFQVKDCWDEMGSAIQRGLQNTIMKCTRSGTRERKRAYYRHSNPAGNLFSLCLGGCEVGRLVFVVQLVEFLCIIDDVLEDLPHGEALVEHDILCEAVHNHNEPEISMTTPFTENTRPEWISFLREIKQEMMELDPVRSPALFLTFEQSLRSRDSSVVDFDTLEEYLPYRLLNFDYEFVSQLLLWAMNIDLTPEETSSPVLQDFKHSIGIIVGLVNDYFSWEMEKVQLEQSDRVRNAVAVVMKERRIPERKAKAEVKKVILREEVKVKLTMALLHGTGQRSYSEALGRYLDELEVFAGGYSYWCATCPRYSRPQSDSDETSDDSD
ncbi:hypothetical protein E1B28_007970 [Marasmius oreades]|uniref:Isoprenoid synthase domain-containing protein n=1 Tax=Marasmius oreades TaxID=181124 RepID=A0A9P7UW17_9AGAR|nr:uncharacterized protein E1B28_007970 [Marasmius oreades]KAG7094369.1 hypothetical protein E1B28_007970 [Marasmius oreades]